MNLAPLLEEVFSTEEVSNTSALRALLFPCGAHFHFFRTNLKLLLKDSLDMSCLTCHVHIPVVPHKAVAEVSRIGIYRRDWLL